MHTNLKPDKIDKKSSIDWNTQLSTPPGSNSSTQGYLYLALYQDRKHPVERANYSFTSPPGFSLPLETELIGSR